MLWYLAGASILVVLLRLAQLRLALSRAKHPSIAGHARIARRIAALIPHYEYDEASFFRADDAPAEVAEEQTEFTVVLTGAGDKKINVIKEVRSVRPDLGLKEAKDLVEGAPQNVKENISKQEAAEIKAKLEAAGASVTVQ